MFSNVDLPHPDEPTRQTSSWSATSNEIPSMARTVTVRDVRKSFTTSRTTSFGADLPVPVLVIGGALDTTGGVTVVPTATPGCGANGGTGR